MTGFVLFGGMAISPSARSFLPCTAPFVNGRLDPEFSFIGAAREALSDDDFRVNALRLALKPMAAKPMAAKSN